jgi:HD-GYP domain-containing protein (c-di-GMP phosphodiesterase class II)
MRFRPPLHHTNHQGEMPWRTEVGSNEAIFDLALVGGVNETQGQGPGLSMVFRSPDDPSPSVSLSISAKDAMRLVQRTEDEAAADAGDVLQRLRAMVQVSIGLGAETDKDRLFTKIMDFIFEIFPVAERAFVVMSRQEQGDEVLKPVVALTRDGTSRELSLSRTIVNEVIRQRHSILSNDAGSDQRFGSHDSIVSLNIRSVMCVPLLVEDEVLGLIQVDTHSRRHSFNEDDLHILTAIGAQVGIALKNFRLYEDIERLFEGFVTASVHAIEARDPTTAGHSFRVAEYTQRLAEAVDRTDSAALRPIRFDGEQMRELRYAALLHDFGKVGVREHVLTKAKKLYPRQFDLLQERFRFARASLERHAYRELLDLQERTPLSASEFKLRRREMERRLKEETKRMQQFLALIVQANEPAVQQEVVPENLQAIADYLFPEEDGKLRPLLTEFELGALTLSRGSLTPLERAEIESHVSHTFAFLQHIPWTKNLAAVPDIAHAHHEKLDGSGYPRGITRETIPIQARLMAVADIYDALTAGDRPYKRSLTEEMALDILLDEAREGRIEQSLVEIFIECGAYKLLNDGCNNRG